MDELILSFYKLTVGNASFNQMIFRSNDVDFQFRTSDQSMLELKDLLQSLAFTIELDGNIITSKLRSDDQATILFSTYELLSKAIYDNALVLERSSLIVLNVVAGFYHYDRTGRETLIKSGSTTASFLVANLRLYLPLLRMFKENKLLSEHDDVINKELLIIDNGKERNLVRSKYTIYEEWILSKRVEFDISAIAGRLSPDGDFNYADWIGIFKHNVVLLLLAQTDQNRTFTELFLNMPFVLANTVRDYEIFVSGFSFERVKSQLKEDKEVYFQTLNQAQEKVKAQVIAVPLSIGTTVYAFFQMDEDIRTFYFVLGMVGIYILFICWYLVLYDQDLRKLKRDIKRDSDEFNNRFPKVYDIFREDFKYIQKKVRSVLRLSLMIKLTIILSWFVLLIYVLVVVKNPVSISPFKFVNF